MTEVTIEAFHPFELSRSWFRLYSLLGLTLEYTLQDYRCSLDRGTVRTGPGSLMSWVPRELVVGPVSLTE